jgi:hypothetical protein
VLSKVQAWGPILQSWNAELKYCLHRDVYEYFQPSSFALYKRGKKYYDFRTWVPSFIPDIDFQNPMLITTQEIYTFTHCGFLYKKIPDFYIWTTDCRFNLEVVTSFFNFFSIYSKIFFPFPTWFFLNFVR